MITSRVNAEQLAHVVSAVSLVIGAGLTAAPRPVAKVFGYGDHAGFPTPSGSSTWRSPLACCAGRPRWPWMAGRAALNW
ncbi:hypothetical protein [Saccharopolyspora pogona]|uniref:hypothetical protein n=1 Tax=Saccharopolyspora pogona TaxID=333966 RepID=UPI001CC23799|nr:hypothetical protein [Saccharopolyspora pogona]